MSTLVARLADDCRSMDPSLNYDVLINLSEFGLRAVYKELLMTGHKPPVDITATPLVAGKPTLAEHDCLEEFLDE